MSRTDGGPAFPGTGTDSSGCPVPEHYSAGMTLRDYFAAKAMQGWLASFGPEDAVKPASVADFAYGIADAMLKAREVAP
ncbi:MAG: hypothetical protein Q8Q73_19135 [Stagnimonas sp.]|nr:hypothetical protein [Stagnimonas sp.]